jgi:hypothetical protein
VREAASEPLAGYRVATRTERRSTPTRRPS